MDEKTRASSENTSKTNYGLTCPECGCHHFRVLYTRARLGGKITRWRECRFCGKRVTALETFLGEER